MATDADRLHLLYDLNRQLATFTDLDDVLRFATAQARTLLDADGCALLLLDRSRDELFFPVSSQRASNPASAARLAEIRFPASQGVAGWVLAHRKAVGVDDVTRDPRFYRGVDASSGATTRSLLCAPLRSSGDVRGVVSVVNPAAGTEPGEVEFLDAIANDIAVAFDRAELYARLRAEAREARWAGRVAGLGLAGLGVALVVGTAFGQAAQALPMSELAWRPSVWAGIIVAACGAVLFGAMRTRR